jgi:phosphoribosylamine--glycine ligase
VLTDCPLATPLATLLYKAATDNLDDVVLHWKDISAVTVVLASEGYPESPVVGAELVIPAQSDATIFHAGTSLSASKLLSSGGRVLTITGVGKELAEARDIAYKAISKILLKNSFFRSDIALKASLQQQGKGE